MLRYLPLLIAALVIFVACGEPELSSTPDGTGATGGAESSSQSASSLPTSTAVASEATSATTVTETGATAVSAGPTPYPTLPAVSDVTSCEHAADLWIERYQIALMSIADISMESVRDEVDGPANYELFEDELERQITDIEEQAEAIGCTEDEIIILFLARTDTLIADNPNAVQILAEIQEYARTPTATPLPEASATAALTDPTLEPPTAEMGREIVETLCAICHTVAGTKAQANIGPELTGFADRPQIAGVLDNNEENLRLWLADPPAVKPGTAMPNLGLTEQQIAALVAFFYTLDEVGD